MTLNLKERLKELDIDLPESAPKPGANFLPVKRVGNLLYVSGQVPVRDGVDQYVGKVGRDVTIEDGQAAARLCAVNMLAQVNRAVDGDFSRIAGCVRLGGFVNAAEDFTEHPKVINGASDLMVAVLGDAGRHTRAAVGCISLPRGVAVELEGIFELA
ncbi:RidA family protein [Burkholderia multivorans]|uniref:RidA family protein n=1 Tax=Burkholderia multivorans TaxID=87883 RepID=UPI001C22BAEE|nr:RidA family protein [Burkholderia multivorans]MBU9223457.1 RidA family protein [Burkholderia multivorans]MBU9418089.1 RidA family protein [Burkholderia multivorans]MBU9478780.1 RidA family protein [Burkholderia multivorans]